MPSLLDHEAKLVIVGGVGHCAGSLLVTIVSLLVPCGTIIAANEPGIKLLLVAVSPSHSGRSDPG
jgi:hypothetical protein